MDFTNQPEVLVIDPDPSIRTLLAAVLRRSGICPTCAGDCDTALEYSRSTRYAAVIVEPRMRGGDRLLRELRSFAPKVIIATTSTTSSEEADAVLRKPFNMDELTAVLAKCCGRGRG